MALTLATTPDAFSGTGMPMLYSVTSDRDGALSTTVTLADYSGTVAGTVKGTTPGVHGLLTGDIVQITNTSMNGVYSVTKIDTDEFYFTATYSATDNSGNVIKLNNNFQVRCDVKDGTGTTTWATIRKSAYGGAYAFDISNIVQSRLTTAPLAIGGTASVVDTTSYITYECTFTEEYDDEDGLLKEGDDATDTARAAIWGATQYWQDQDIDDYLGTAGDTGLFLTTAPTIYLRRGDELQLSLITTSVSSAYLYATLNNGTSDTSDITTAVNLTAAGTAKVTFPVNSNLYASDTVTMTLVAKDQDDDPISETRTVYIDNLTDNGTVIWWLNPLGGYDSYRFRGEADKYIDADRKTYRTYDSTKKNHVDKVLSVESSERYELMSDWLRPNEGEWLAQILRSTDVRMQESGGTLRRVIVDNDSEMVDGVDMVKLNLRYTIAEGLK